jgi:hypothetical protein
VTTEAIQDGWDGVLQALMARRKVAWMVVRTASVVSLVEGSLTLQFPKPGDVKGFMSSGYEGLLKEVLYERFGINVMIRPTAGGGSAGGPGPGARRGAPQSGQQATPAVAPPQPPSPHPVGPSAMQSAAVQVQAPAPGHPAATGDAPVANQATAPGRATATPSGPAAAIAPSHVAPTPAALVTNDYGSFGDDVPYPTEPTDDDPYALDGDEIEGSVDAGAGIDLTGISLIQRDLGAQIIAEYEE